MWEVEWFDGATRADWLQEELLKVNGEDRDGQRENGCSGTNEGGITSDWVTCRYSILFSNNAYTSQQLFLYTAILTQLKQTVFN